jgi:hypothetical protein
MSAEQERRAKVNPEITRLADKLQSDFELWGIGPRLTIEAALEEAYELGRKSAAKEQNLQPTEPDPG